MLGPTVAIFAITVLSAMPPLSKYIHVEGLALAAHRFFWLALGLSVVFYARGGRLTTRAIRLAWPAGVLFAGNIALFYTAVKITTVANATVIGAIQPVLSLLIVGPLFGERVYRSDIVTTAGAIVGVSIVVYGSSITPVWSPTGDLLALLAVLLWTAYLVVTKRARTELPAIELQTVLTMVATVVILPIALLSGQSFAVPRADIGWLALLVIVPGFGHTLVNWVHNHTSLVMVSVQFLLNPVVATALAALFLDEPVNGYQMAGMAVVLVSIAILVTRLQRRASSQQIEPDTADQATKPIVARR
jgi:drug/metabolite transporter (DMT)-like permease